MKREPVLLAALVRAAAVLAAAFGFDLTVEQIAGVIVVVELIAGVVVRAKVTPVAAPRLP